MMRVPNLCIHLQSAAERASFTINKETHLARPTAPPALFTVLTLILCQLTSCLLLRLLPAGGLAAILGIDMEILATEELNKENMDDRHSPAFLNLIAEEAGCAVDAIQDFDLTVRLGCMKTSSTSQFLEPKLKQRRNVYTLVQYSSNELGWI